MFAPKVVFDVDGCLIHSNTTALHELMLEGNTIDAIDDLEIQALVDMPRPEVIRLMEECYYANWNITVHSGGGASYARMICNRIEVSDMVNAYAAKDDRLNGTWDISFDDQPVKFGKLNVLV